MQTLPEFTALFFFPKLPVSYAYFYFIPVANVINAINELVFRDWN